MWAFGVLMYLLMYGHYPQLGKITKHGRATGPGWRTKVWLQEHPRHHDEGRKKPTKSRNMVNFKFFVVTKGAKLKPSETIYHTKTSFLSCFFRNNFGPKTTVQNRNGVCPGLNRAHPMANQGQVVPTDVSRQNFLEKSFFEKSILYCILKL